jgi:hypothetical protein
MTSINTNISDYTLSELMAIIEIDELIPDDIVENTNYFIKKYKTKDPALSVFFKDIQSQLLQFAQGLEPETDNEDYQDKIVVEGYANMSNDAIYPSGDKMVNDWYKNEYLTQSDENQTNKITDRKQKIQLFNNPQVPMNREQLATTDTYNLSVKQDSLNPNLKNTINRFINLDSQFRQYTSGVDSISTDYTCDLSDTIKNALSLSLYSYQISLSWYVIDKAYGNNCFWISDFNNNNKIPIYIPSGNYSQSGFVTQLNNSFLQAGFSFPARTNTTLYPSPPYPSPALDSNTPAYYNQNSGILSLFLTDGSYNGSFGTFNITSNTQIIFYDFTGILQCNVNCLSKSKHYFNNTLGWIMGYRLPYYNVDVNGNTAPCVLDLNGTKYLILVIDDFNQNHVNNSLVSISQFTNSLKMPMYYSPDIPYICISPSQERNNLPELIAGVGVDSLFSNQTINAQNGLLIAGKYEQDYTKTQISLPSAPRTLTSAQLYTINSISINNNNLTNYLAKAPTSSDILAIIPVKTSVGVPTGSLLVEFSGSLQNSKRTYFGPVNIDRMAVRLLDDKGNVLNLNGSDWCVSLIAECLYQY